MPERTVALLLFGRPALGCQTRRSSPALLSGWRRRSLIFSVSFIWCIVLLSASPTYDARLFRILLGAIKVTPASVLLVA